MLLVGLRAHATEVWAFTDQAHPLTSIGAARVVKLDAPAKIEADLGKGLPANPERAAAQVRARLTEGGCDLQQRMATAYQGVADAWSLDVSHIPAVVVDQRYVVYGEQDVAKAVVKIEAYRRRRP
ncbi:TIGR03757 family integrating conjugative element protein [Achromobacter xylosoxidans]